VEPCEVAAAQVDGLAVGREARRRGEGECAVGLVHVEGDVRCVGDVGDGVCWRRVGAGAEDGGAALLDGEAQVGERVVDFGVRGHGGGGGRVRRVLGVRLGWWLAEAPLSWC
jgi:hypothetical protein